MHKPLLTIIALSLLGSAPLPATAQTPMPARAAHQQAQTTGRLDPEAILKVADHIAAWQINNYHNPKDNERNAYWHRDRQGWVWGAFYTGLTEYATQTGNTHLINEMRKIADVAQWRNGHRQRHADDWAVLWSYAELYALDREPDQIAASTALIDALRTQPWDESLEWGGGIENRELAWCDALFMGPPSIARVARVTGNKAYLDFADSLWWKTTDFLYNTEEHLYARDARYFDKTEPNGKPVFWARGNGWVFAGLPRMIEDLPPDYVNKPRYEQLYREMAARLLEIQQPSGFWATGLLDPERWDRSESSGTAFFTYGLAWGINHGYLDEKTYRPAVEKGWNALLSVTNDEGRLTHTQPIGEDPYDFNPDSTMPYGMGGMLLAASEVYKLALLDGTASTTITAANPLNEPRLYETIELPYADLDKAFRAKAKGADFIVLDTRNGDLCSAQPVDTDEDGTPDQLLFQAFFGPMEAKQFRVHALPRGAASHRARGAVSARYVPERKDDFAWENDRTVYRMYGPALVAENASGGVDAWVKSTRVPVIDDWYEADDYHTDHGQGLDAYKVGSTAGAGGLVAMRRGDLFVPPPYEKQRLIASGPVRAIFELTYGQWGPSEAKRSHTLRVSLDRGASLTRYQATFDKPVAENVALGPGIVRRETNNGSFSETERWLTLWQPIDETGSNGEIGIAALVPPQGPNPAPAQLMTTQDHTLLLTNHPANPFVYYAGTAWSKSREDTTQTSWNEQVRAEAARLASPIRVISTHAQASLPTPVTLKQNGGWCWFQDERAIITNNQLIFATVACHNRADAYSGDIDVTSVDLTTRVPTTTTIHPTYQADDHNAPALLELADGRILAAYAPHGGGARFTGREQDILFTTTTRPHDITSWTKTSAFEPTKAGISYANLAMLSAENNRLYDFFRAGVPGDGWDWHYATSDDQGQTWTLGGRLLRWDTPTGDPRYTGMDGGRPYPRFVSNGTDTIHLIVTEDHPRAYDNSIYHAMIKQGALHDSRGTRLAPLGKGQSTTTRPNDLTPVFVGDADHVAWTSSIELDAWGNPVVAFSVQTDDAQNRRRRNQGGADHRYHYATFDGTRWHEQEIAYAGTRLYAGEDDYTGLITISPNDTNTVYISTNAHPETGTPLISAADNKRHWEIYKGTTTDGSSFTWTPLTQNSTQDNLRPIVPANPKGPNAAKADTVLWLRGTYRSYRDYDLDVMALLP